MCSKRGLYIGDYAGSDSITTNDVRDNGREVGRGEGVDTGYADIRDEEREETSGRYERVCRRGFSAPIRPEWDHSHEARYLSSSHHLCQSSQIYTNAATR